MMEKEMTNANNKPFVTERAYRVVCGVQRRLTTLLFLCTVFSFFGFCLVRTGSMEPTLMVGEYAFFRFVDAQELAYDDIVVFLANGDPTIDENAPHVSNYLAFAMQTLFGGNRQNLVKRLIGKPGDVIEVRDGYVWRNGEKLDPDYLSAPTEGTFGPYAVPEGHYFVMGDNRQNSLDSRHIGAVPANAFFGKVLFHLHPWRTWDSGELMLHSRAVRESRIDAIRNGFLDPWGRPPMT